MIWPPGWDPVSWVVSWQEFCTSGCDERTWVWETEKSSLGRSSCQETANGYCNILKALIHVCQWYVKCSSKLFIQVVNTPSKVTYHQIRDNIHYGWSPLQIYTCFDFIKCRVCISTNFAENHFQKYFPWSQASLIFRLLKLNILKVKFLGEIKMSGGYGSVGTAHIKSVTGQSQSSRRHLLSNGRINTFPQQRSLPQFNDNNKRILRECILLYWYNLFSLSVKIQQYFIYLLYSLLDVTCFGLSKVSWGNCNYIKLLNCMKW
jgi:hypothetical protein